MTNNGREEARLASRFRIVGFIVLLITAVLYIAASFLQLPFLRPDFQPDSAFLGVILGAILVLGGVEALSRIPGIGPK